MRNFVLQSFGGYRGSDWQKIEAVSVEISVFAGLGTALLLGNQPIEATER